MGPSMQVEAFPFPLLFVSEEDWGGGLKVLTTHFPEHCEHRARQNDVIHYHYIGRLASTGVEFGKR